MESSEEDCTHLVIEESYKLDLATGLLKATHVVKQEVHTVISLLHMGSMYKALV